MHKIMLSIQYRKAEKIWKEKEGSITIRRTAIPSNLVNFSTFAFLLNFSFLK